MIPKYRLFVFIFIPAALALAAGMALVQQKNTELSFGQFESQLQSQWELAALVAESPSGLTELKKLSDRHGLRVTLVDAEGAVLADSVVEGPWESHRDREEIRNALAGTPFTALRPSDTTGSYTIYYAAPLPGGRVLRVAYPASYYDGRKNALMEQTMTGLLVLVAVVGLFAIIISRRSSTMLAALSRAVKEAQGGGLELPSFGNDDMDKALFALSSANRELKRYGEENLQLRQRLEYILAHIEEGVILLVDDRIVYRNQRAEDILQFPLPGTLAAINSQEMMDVFASFRGGQTGELQLDDRTIVVSQTVAEASRLIMLHDVSAREKYSGYKSDLVGNISHELKTPLALIMGASEVILKDADMPRTYLDKFLGTIYKNTQRINQLLDDLIFLHHLEGAQESEAGETEVREIIEDLRDLLGRIDKKVSYQFDPVRVRIHATHLISVFTNLIINADKYSKGETIDVTARKSGAVLEIRVSDQGPLIAPAEMERIFERFYTVSKSRNRGASGSGLGLSIVKHIARLYQGQAWVEPNPQGGNTFVVRLVER